MAVKPVILFPAAMLLFVSGRLLHYRELLHTRRKVERPF